MIHIMSKQPKRIIFLNGKFVTEHEAHLSIFDTAISTGEKVVEVVRTFNQVPHEIDDHIRRLFSGINRIDLKIKESPREIKQYILETLSKNIKKHPKDYDWQIICYLSKGPASHFEIVPAEELKPTIVIQCLPLVNRIGKMAYKYQKGIPLIVVKQKVIPNDIIPPQLKSNGRMDHVMARIEAKRISPSSSGVLLDNYGYVTESTGSSLFFVKNGAIFTADSSQVLNGITRSLILKIAKKHKIPLKEKKFKLKEALKADEAFVTSTIICLVHANSFNGKKFGDGNIGPVTSKIRKGFIKEVKQNFVAKALQYAEALNIQK